MQQLVGEAIAADADTYDAPALTSWPIAGAKQFCAIRSHLSTAAKMATTSSGTSPCSPTTDPGYPRFTDLNFGDQLVAASAVIASATTIRYSKYGARRS